MEIQLIPSLILTVCVVYVSLRPVQPLIQASDRAVPISVNSESAIQENDFQNLFESIAKNNAKKSEIYHEIVEQEEIARERQAFDTMKKELRIAQNRNILKKANIIGDNILAVKREIGEPTGEISFEFNITILENMFFEHHFDTENLVWKEVESLTPEVLERICIDDILMKTLPRSPLPINVSSYGYAPVTGSKLHEERVIKDAILLTRNRKKEVKITVVKCTFARFTFFITHATDDHVFTLWSDVKPNRFRLRAGMYLVHYH